MDAAVTDRALSAAREAADRAGVSVDLLREVHELEAAERLLSEVWNVEGQVVVAAHLMKALLYSGNYVSGALSNGQLVGTSIGFVGRHDAGVHLHSHITGVSNSMQGRSVGFALKQHQRAWALQQGFEEVVWTFDPLVRRNGYFNIVKLGAEIVAYERDFYGAMRDAINAEDDSDRCVVSWRLASPRAIEAARGHSYEAMGDPEQPTVVLGPDDAGTPQLSLQAGDVLAVQVPEDIVALRRSQPDQAHSWRRALRDAFEWAFADGYRVTGMTREAGYLLRRPS
ncbi:MAG TPA: GNAT family N-acetyltransferase [Actinomycetota bacterium]|nr:GNAT family N-acetyltransferase [Actinomycetota bacterium]